MSLKRTTTWMAALTGVLLMALPASGQGIGNLQLFAPAEVSSYGGGVRPNEGFFFTLDLLYWSFSAPEGVDIGFPSAGRRVWYGPGMGDESIQTNNINTSMFSQDWDGGERFEIGDRWCHHGWMVGTLKTHTHGQEIAASGANMIWDDPIFGPLNRRRLQGYYLLEDAEDPTLIPPDVDPTDIIRIDGEVGILRDLPVTFDDMIVSNRTQIWGVEAMYSYRTHPKKHGGFFEFYFGGRYMEVDDRFTVDATNRVEDEGDLLDPLEFLTPGASLADSHWTTRVDNNIVGPQVALRWFRKSDRWTIDTSGRFLAGFNSQNFRQQGTLGTRLAPGADFDPEENEGRPLLMAPTSFRRGAFMSEFSPVIEMRVNLEYQFTKAIAMRLGWTGMWVNGIARGSEVNVYQVPDMGLDLDNNYSDIFVHGFNCGVLMNY